MIGRPRFAKMVLGGLAQLVLVAVIAGGIGAVVGFGLSRLSNDGDGVAPAVKPPSAQTQTQTAPASPGRVDVRVIDSVLHPASSASGQRRRRARLSVRIRAENRGQNAVTPARPTLIVGEARKQTDPSADSPRTSMGSLASGEIVNVTLRFEVAGDVTTQLAGTQRARIRVAGRSRTIAIKVGTPVTAPASSGAGSG